MRATVIGASGYAGRLLCRLLALHPNISHILPASRSDAGRPTHEALPELPQSWIDGRRLPPRIASIDEALDSSTEVLFSALPHGASATVCQPVIGTLPIIDLSADFRFTDVDLYERIYETVSATRTIMTPAVYGLVEHFRPEITRARLVANPGCYPTATLLPLLPLASEQLIEGTVVANALSGISGAGRGVKLDALFCERSENCNAYKPGSVHRHHAEITEKLNAVTDRLDKVIFTPHLVPMIQGMTVTTTVRCTDPARAIECLQERYHNEPFVELLGETPPHTAHVRETNRAQIGWAIDGTHLILMSTIDNLWKGASSQAIQNMNLMLGFEEDAGLNLPTRR